MRRLIAAAAASIRCRSSAVSASSSLSVAPTCTTKCFCNFCNFLSRFPWTSQLFIVAAGLKQASSCKIAPLQTCFCRLNSVLGRSCPFLCPPPTCNMSSGVYVESSGVMVSQCAFPPFPSRHPPHPGTLVTDLQCLKHLAKSKPQLVGSRDKALTCGQTWLATHGYSLDACLTTRCTCTTSSDLHLLWQQIHL